MTAVSLRPTLDGDFEAIFELESDVAGADMIALLPREPGDRTGFAQDWERVRADATVIRRTIEVDGGFAGYAVSFLLGRERQVGYWIERGLWGRGIASAALAAPARRPRGAAALGPCGRATTSASRRVLERAGFSMVATERVHWRHDAASRSTGWCSGSTSSAIARLRRAPGTP